MLYVESGGGLEIAPENGVGVVSKRVGLTLKTIFITFLRAANELLVMKKSIKTRFSSSCT